MVVHVLHPPDLLEAHARSLHLIPKQVCQLAHKRVDRQPGWPLTLAADRQAPWHLHLEQSQLPAERDELTLADLLGATEGILEYPQPTAEERELGERGRLGSKQLRKLRKTLERNRLTMPLFDTRGWVRDFEKALKIQWEIYANGLAPMHIVVARSDRIYGTEVVTQEGAQRNP